VPPTTVPDTGAVSLWCGVKQTLDANCTVCHNEQKTAGAPMALKQYADLQVAAISDPTKKVYQVVGTRVHDTVKPMPPQQKLTVAQLNGIDTWVAAGAPPGADPTCAGVTPTPATGPAEDTWPTNCDGTMEIRSHATGSAEPFSVPPGQEIHPQVSVPAPWGSEAVQAIAFRSLTDNPKVLHHWILNGPSGEFLTGWAPGKQVISAMGTDVGMHMAGGTLRLDMHYNNLSGTAAELDKSGVEVCWVKKANFRKNTAAVYQRFSQFLINIPAKTKGFDVTGNCTIAGAGATLITASPHAHTTARHMKFTVKKASGEMIVMHDAPFAFSEQQSYTLDKPIVLAAGDVVTTTCTFDNDTNRAITFGEDTGNEMCFNFAVYYPMGALSCSGGGFGGR
jgi:hypothetical protein